VPASGGPGAVTEKSSLKKSQGDVTGQDSVSLSPQLTIQPADATAHTGKEYRVDVLAKQVQGLDRETFALEFDPKILEFRDATMGEVVGVESGKAAVAVSSVDGIVELRLPGSTSAAKDEGRLLRLTFLAKAPGVSPLRMRVVKHGEVDSPEGASEAKGVVRVR